MERRVFGVLLTLLLAMLSLTIDPKPVEAVGTIYIRADGSVDPETAPISTVDNVTYTFTDNIYDEIVVQRDDIIIEGAAYTLQGAGSGTGIRLSSTNNLTIRNMRIQAFSMGINVYQSSNNSIHGNSITNNDYGIELDYSSNNTISGNNIAANSEEGIELDYSSNNTISGNNITHNDYGIYFYGSSNNNNIISGNNITNSDYGLWLEGTLNTIFGNNIANNRAYTGSEGIYIGYSVKNNIVSGNNIVNNYYGIELYDDTNNNTIYGNNIANNEWYGLFQSGSSDNAIHHNNFVNNTKQVLTINSVNIWDDGVEGNYWSNYTGVDSNHDGIGDTAHVLGVNNTDHYPLMGPWTEIGENVSVTHETGVSLTFENVTVSGITTVNETETGPDPPSGFKLASEPPIYYDISTTADYTEMIEISIPFNDTGLTEEEQIDLKLIHWNETIQQWEDITTLVDTENNIIHGETRHLSMFGVTRGLRHDIAISEINSLKTVVGQSFILHIDVTIVNNGEGNETFSISIYMNGTSVASQAAYLTSGNSTTTTFTWNTTGYAKGSYTIGAYAIPVQNETNTLNNNLTDGWVIIAMIGDITGPEGEPDGQCNMRDVGLVARYFGQNVPPAPANCDITGPITGVADGTINMRDIGLVARHFGETDS